MTLTQYPSKLLIALAASTFFPHSLVQAQYNQTGYQVHIMLGPEVEYAKSSTDILHGPFTVSHPVSQPFYGVDMYPRVHTSNGDKTFKVSFPLYTLYT